MKRTSKNDRTPLRSTEASAPRSAQAHYTDETLAYAFTAEALRVWASRWCGMGGHELWERETRIVDPACGDGGLLWAAAHGVWAELAHTPKHRALRTSADALAARVQSRLHGVDTRQDAVDAARAALPGATFTCGDGLCADADGALVIMNPPWAGRSKRTPEATAQIKQITGTGTPDLAVAFMRAYPRARQISAILPKAVTEGDSRTSGLQWMVANGWRIASATPRRPWPGRASVMYVTVHLENLSSPARP